MGGAVGRVQQRPIQCHRCAVVSGRDVIPVVGHKRIIAGGGNRAGNRRGRRAADPLQLKYAAGDAELESTAGIRRRAVVRANNFLVASGGGGTNQGFERPRRLTAVAHVQVRHCQPVGTWGGGGDIALVGAGRIEVIAHQVAGGGIGHGTDEIGRAIHIRSGSEHRRDQRRHSRAVAASAVDDGVEKAALGTIVCHRRGAGCLVKMQQEKCAGIRRVVADDVSLAELRGEQSQREGEE